MDVKDLIPPSPSAEDYAAAHAANADESVFDRDDPFELFAEWLKAAGASEPNDPNAMALSTVDADGTPDSRMVLLKDVDARGFTFHTNLDSAKGMQLAARPQAALLFHWKTLRRQVRVRGAAERVSVEEADAYFATRSRGARIGAWASEQSRPLTDRAELERRVAEQTARFEIEDRGRPPRWSGFRIVPAAFEFWRDRPFRLHDRLVFQREGSDGAWRTGRLYP